MTLSTISNDFGIVFPLYSKLSETKTTSSGNEFNQFNSISWFFFTIKTGTRIYAVNNISHIEL